MVVNELQRALGDIHRIRRQVADQTRFHGYGPATLAATGVLAVLAACLQQVWVFAAVDHLAIYLSIWMVTALVSAALTGWQMWTRSRRLHSALSNEMIGMAAQQFLPSLATGLLLTLVLVDSVPQAVWMLPGLWQLIYSLGIFASCRFLPSSMLAAGVWYLLSGLSCLLLGQSHPLSAVQMGIPFAVGQGMIAFILRFCSSEAAKDED